MSIAAPSLQIRRQAVHSSAAALWPRITIVIAASRVNKHLAETIESIQQQKYPNLEHAILEDSRLLTANGAVNRRLQDSSGEVMGWLNAGDTLHPGSLFVIGRVFRELKQVEWVTGRPSTINEQGSIVEVGEAPRWSRYRFLADSNAQIQRESTFWRRSLWEKACGRLRTPANDAQDAAFELWVRFFRHAKLHAVDALIGGCRGDSWSRKTRELAAPSQARNRLVEEELRTIQWGLALRFARAVGKGLQGRAKPRAIWDGAVNRVLGCIEGRCAPIIEFEADGRRVRLIDT